MSAFPALRIFTLCCLILVALPAVAARTNQLLNNPSPYLAMHGKDPVHWQTWSPEVMEQARREQRLVFISSGYFSCHWCHVMQRESYQNAEIAHRLNSNFIAVKVDRELLPALDARLIDFVQATRGSAGWPLNVFITPEGYPLVGMTYLPPDRFEDFLDHLTARWRDDRSSLMAMARSRAEEIKSSLSGQKKSELLNPAYFRKQLLRSSWRFADEMSGGFGSQTKFPMAPQLLALLDIAQSRPDRRLSAFLNLTLAEIMKGGLRDHIGGGFFRYSTDPQWQVPHFEKMLYDNAQLVRVFLRAAEVFNNPGYRSVAFETLDFMLREMWTSEHAFVASFSAVDDKGVEGGFYLWRSKQIERLLLPGEWQVARLRWALDRPPELEHGHLLKPRRSIEQISADTNLSPEDIGKRLAAAKHKLLLARADRKLPVDDKLIAGWNALALDALRQAAQTPGGDRFRSVARKLAETLGRRFWNGHGLSRAIAMGQPAGVASLEDYAFTAHALIEWSRAGGKAGDRDIAIEMIDQAWKKYYVNGGWRLSESTGLADDPTDPLIADGVLPSPQAVLIDATLALPGKARSSRALASLQALTRAGSDGLLWRASYLFPVTRAAGRNE